MKIEGITPRQALQLWQLLMLAKFESGKPEHSLFIEACNDTLRAAKDLIENGDNEPAKVFIRKQCEARLPRKFEALIEGTIANDQGGSRKHIQWMRDIAKFPFR